MQTLHNWIATKLISESSLCFIHEFSPCVMLSERRLDVFSWLSQMYPIVAESGKMSIFCWIYSSINSDRISLSRLSYSRICFEWDSIDVNVNSSFFYMVGFAITCCVYGRPRTLLFSAGLMRKGGNSRSSPTRIYILLKVFSLGSFWENSSLIGQTTKTQSCIRTEGVDPYELKYWILKGRACRI